jgi:hypothetical protein
MLSAKLNSLVFFLGLFSLSYSAAPADAGNTAGEPSVTALQRSVRLQEQLDRIDRQLEKLVSVYGPYDHRLLDTLQQLTDVMVEIGDYARADAILERRLQLVRIAEGPVTLSQIPLVDELISNDIRRNDWDSVTDRFETLYWLQSQAPDAHPRALLQARDDLVHWYFAAVYLDAPTRRLHRFQDARELIRQNLQLAEDLFGEDSLELARWLYRQAVLLFQLVAVIAADDELGADARERILLIEAGGAERYLREALNQVKRSRAIVAASGDPESAALAMVYEADFHMLLDPGTALDVYREAMGKMREAGFGQDEIDAFFQRPVVLPEQEFHLQLADAISYQDSYGYQVKADPGGASVTVHLGGFTAWSDSLPFARRPPLPERAKAVEAELSMEEMEIQFTLNRRGYTRNPAILESSSDGAGIRREARQALKEMTFRPWLANGRWQRVKNLQIRYRL